MCDLLLFFGIASTQDEFVLFDKIAQTKSITSFLLLYLKKMQKNKHELVRLL